MKAWLFRGVLALVVYVSLELVALAGLALLRSRGWQVEPLPLSLTEDQTKRLDRLFTDTAMFTRFSPTLGWTIRPNAVVPPFYRANSQGIRGNRDYQQRPGGDTVRVAAFVDSFTNGVGVTNDSTWAAVAERRLPGVEILNFGVASYGVDQAYLRYREEGRAFHSDVILIGFIAENVNRHVNHFRPFYVPGASQPLGKPRFVLRDGDLVLIPNSLSSQERYLQLAAAPAEELPKLGRHDHFFRSRLYQSPWDPSPLARLFLVAIAMGRQRVDAPDVDGLYNERSEAFRVTARLFERFVADVRADGAAPLIVIFPGRGDLRRQMANRPRVYQPLTAFFDRQGLPYLDMLEAFAGCRDGCPVDSLVPMHYSNLGNRIVGEHLADQLQRRGLLRPGDRRPR